MKIKHLIVSTDLSENSGIAAKWAAELAAKIGADITVLHVIETGFLTWIKSDMDLFDNKELVAAAEQKVIDWFSGHANVAPDYVRVEAGSPLVQIGNLVREYAEPSMVVLARSSKGGFEKFFLGSTVQQVVVNPPAPIAIVHPDHATLAENHPIVTGTDFSDNAYEAVQFAADMSRDLGLDVHLLHASTIPESNAFADVGGLGMDIKERIEQLASEKLTSFVERDIDFSDVQCEADLVFDKLAADALLDAVNMDEADIVVVGHNGASPLVQNVLGSVTQQVLRSIPTTLVIVPSTTTDPDEEE